jgi:hypothetical protein
MHQPLTSCIPIYIAASPIHTPVPCVAWCCLVWAQVVLASLVRTLAGLRASSSSLVDALVGSKRDRRSSIPLSRGIVESLNKVRVVCNVWLRVGGQRWWWSGWTWVNRVWLVYLFLLQNANLTNESYF